MWADVYICVFFEIALSAGRMATSWPGSQRACRFRFPFMPQDADRYSLVMINKSTGHGTVGKGFVAATLMP